MTCFTWSIHTTHGWCFLFFFLFLFWLLFHHVLKSSTTSMKQERFRCWQIRAFFSPRMEWEAAHHIYVYIREGEKVRITHSPSHPLHLITLCLINNTIPRTHIRFDSFRFVSFPNKLRSTSCLESTPRWCSSMWGSHTRIVFNQSVCVCVGLTRGPCPAPSHQEEKEKGMATTTQSRSCNILHGGLTLSPPSFKPATGILGLRVAAMRWNCSMLWPKCLLWRSNNAAANTMDQWPDWCCQ